ncbi:glycosyltransferase family 2 protein [Bacteroides congonensis]|uniref:glycosyltransferase family 2 protein n=1 Tax=Bacteroides congonensis TaxID=1871006 RepID=UPI002674F101|nr:glycosyltransferase family 2 protein [Bacteroides congonensis]
MVHPTISVILPVYNCEDYIYESVQSILEQTFEDFELLIINDGSTDKSKQIILSLDDKRIRYLENRTNQGLIKTLNKGLHFSEGEFIARMDADDLCVNTRFQMQLEYFRQERNVDILGTNQYIIGTNERILHQSDNEENKVRLLLQPAVAHSSVMIKKRALTRNKLYYDKAALYAEDYKLWIDSSLCGLSIQNLPEYLCGYRIHENQISKIQSHIQKMVTDKIRLAYAKYFFSDIINGNEKDYLLLLLGCPGYLEEEQQKRIEGLYGKLIDKNKEKLYFNQDIFECFLQYRLFNLKKERT